MKNCFHQIRRSIRAKFMVTFLLLLIIPLIISTQIFMTRLYSVLRDKEQTSITEKIRFAGSGLDRIFSDMDQIAVSLILDYRVMDILTDPSLVPSYEWFTGYKSLNSLLGLLNSNSNYAYNITVLGCNDKLYHSGAGYNTMLKTASPLLTPILEGHGDPVIFNRSLEGFDDTPVVTLGRAVYLKKNYLGSILVEVPLDRFEELLSPFDSDSTQMFILENSQKIIYASNAMDTDTVPAALTQALTANATSLTLNGESYLLQQISMEKSHLSAVALVRTDTIFAESTQVVLLYILAFSMTIAATIIGIFMLTSFFTRDITALNMAVSHFGTDSSQTISLPIRTCDEIGQLTDGVISMSYRIKRLLAQVQENERNKRILEFNSLQSQINPHMIYNTLNTITYLAEMQNVNNIREISSSFAYLLRSLSNQGEFISIEQEIAYLKSFIAIKKYHLLSPIQTDFQVDETALGCGILKLLLQPIVENAIIHGFSNRLDDCLLTISIQKNDQKLQIRISDNGNGMDEETIQRILNGEERNHATFLRVGVKNIIDRLALQYGSEASFSIQSAPGRGTAVSISFPAQPCPQERSTL